MVFVTGDTHGDWSRLEKLRYLTEEDTLIVCGDFGLWHEVPRETAGLDRLDKMPFTTVWVDGNHENFDRLLNSNEFERTDFHGASAHKIREHIYHIERGEIMELEGKTFWCFGGASSHDIRDGIVDPSQYESKSVYRRTVAKMEADGKQFRIKGLSWWPEELPNYDEIAHGLGTMIKYGMRVNFIVTHCAPMRIQSLLGFHTQDRLTLFFDTVLSEGAVFDRWFFGHYHINKEADDGKFSALYESVVPAWREEGSYERVFS